MTKRIKAEFPDIGSSYPIRVTIGEVCEELNPIALASIKHYKPTSSVRLSTGDAGGGIKPDCQAMSARPGKTIIHFPTR